MQSLRRQRNFTDAFFMFFFFFLLRGFTFSNFLPRSLISIFNFFFLFCGSEKLPPHGATETTSICLLSISTQSVCLSVRKTFWVHRCDCVGGELAFAADFSMTFYAIHRPPTSRSEIISVAFTSHTHTTHFTNKKWKVLF